MSAKTISFARAMAARFPNLKRIMEDHAAANFGEILPHLFLGEVTEYLASTSLKTDSPSRQELIEVLHFLEDSFTNGDDELQELIAVSFLENLPRQGEPGANIRDIVGPNLKKQLDALG